MKKIGFVLTLVLLSPLFLLAEGSKDFLGYEGVRLRLDTRDQQQFKVYAAEGEYINVGASHLGKGGGYIRVVSPDGQTIDVTFNSNANVDGEGIIYNNIQEAAGPIGSAAGGFRPGSVLVGPGQEGIWTVVFGFTFDYNSPTFDNINFADPWNREDDQLSSHRAILAWDITVSQGGEADAPGASLVEGRVYSNEYIFIIKGNGELTSPTFFVLTRDGFQYQVNFDEADPFRFPISSNSRGLVRNLGNNDFAPIYSSFERSPTPLTPDPNDNVYTRSRDISSWISDEIYLYNPQAEDAFNLLNHKIFFNIPDSNMPGQAIVTDVYAGIINPTQGDLTFDCNTDNCNTHTTWLYNDLNIGPLGELGFSGECEDPFIEFGEVAVFDIETTTGGELTIFVDTNNDGDFDDPVDVTITENIISGLNQIEWDFLDGEGNVFANIGDTIDIRFTGFVRYGEVHISNTDVERNIGGVDFIWLNGPDGNAVNIPYYYDHSLVNGPVSGGGTSGNALPTNTPFTYGAAGTLEPTNNFGNNLYLDQWVFNDDSLDISTVQFIVVEDCSCDDSNTPVLSIGSPSPFNACLGDSIQLSVENTTTGLGDLTYNWQGPNGFSFTQTVAADVPSVVEINPAATTDAGSYIVTATTAQGCVSDPVTVIVAVNPNPDVQVEFTNYSSCVGDDLVINANVLGLPPGNVDFVLNGPGATQSGSVTLPNQIVINLNDISSTDAGTYTIQVSSEFGCIGEGTFQVSINESAVLSDVTGGGGYCAGQDVFLSGTNTETSLTEVTFNWSGPNGFFVENTTTDVDGPFEATISGAQPTDSGDYTLCVTSSDGCGPVCETVTVNVNAGLTIDNITGGGDICDGASTTLSATNSITAGITEVTYTWILPDGSEVVNIAPPAGPFDLALTDLDTGDAGTYSLFLVADNGCTSDTADVDINILPAVEIINVTPDTAVCGNTEIILFGTNSATEAIMYQWTGPNGFSIGGTADPGETFADTISIASEADEGAYVLNIEPSVCANTPITVNVTVDPTPVLSPIQIFSGDAGPYCEGDTVIYFITNSTPNIDTLIWTCNLPNGTIDVNLLPGDDTLFIPFSPITFDDAGLLECSAETPSNCVGSLQTLLIEVPPNPEIVDISQDTSLCSGDSIMLTATGITTGTGDISYTWTGPNGFVFNGTAPFEGPFPVDLNNVMVDMSGEYCLTLIGQGSCPDNTECVTITVNQTPELSAISGTGEYCEGDDVVLSTNNTVTGTGDLDYICIGPDNFTQSGIIAEDEEITITLNGVTLAQAGTYTCIVTSAAGCTDEVSGSITVNAVPNIVNISGGGDDGSYCEGETINLSAENNVSGVGNITYTWTGPNGFEFTATVGGNEPFTASIPNAEISDSGEYCLTVESAAGCGGAEECVDIIVNPNPIVTLEGGGEFCEGDVVTLTATVDPNGAPSVNWTFTGPQVEETGTSTTDETITFEITVTEDSEGSYSISAVSAAGCEDNASTSITVITLDAPELAASPNPLCEGDELTLTVTNSNDYPDGTTFEWFENGVSLGTSDSPNFTVLDAAGGNYSVEVNFENCSETSDEVNVQVAESPVAEDDTFTGDANAPLDGDVLENDFVPNGGVTITITMSPENGTVEINEDGSFTYTPNVGFIGTDMFEYEICSVLCPDDCSIAVAEITIVPTECDEIYNLITPNTSDLNNVFFVPCLEDPDGEGPGTAAFPNNSIKIFNRWGDVVYSAEPYRNDWNAENDDENPLPAGTYFYLITLEVDGGDRDGNQLTGFITVAR